MTITNVYHGYKTLSSSACKRTSWSL